LKPYDRYRSLDAIRGLAALGVVLFHYFNHFAAAPFIRPLLGVYQRGVIFVDLFFVMSGYLLATIYAGRRDFLVLMWRRIARLVPLHWLMLAVVTILQVWLVRRLGVAYVYQNNDAYHFLLNVVLLHCTGLSNGFSFDGPAWSISVEWIVNLLLFALLALGVRRIAWVAAAIALFATFVLWNLGKSLFAMGLYAGFLDALVARGMLGFFAGVALTGPLPLDHQPRDPDSRRGRIVGHLWDVLVVLSVIALGNFMRSNKLAARPGVDFAVALVVIPAMVVGSVRGRWVPRILALPPLQWLGAISYSMYLVHFPVQAVFVLLYPPSNWLNYADPLVFATFLAATLAASFLTYRFVETPAQALLQRVTLRPRRAAPASAC
jgi:peptidoglycan/LPS O-acetylase OafA/YrhL